MPIRKYRDVSEIEDPWCEPADPALHAAIRRVWAFAARTCPLRFPPGVYRHRSLEEADAQREQWETANFAAFQARRSAPR